MSDDAIAVVIKVAGVSFGKNSGASEDRQVLLQECFTKQLKPEVRLVLEPNNPYDANAVKVEFKIDEQWRHIGYVPKAASAEVSQAYASGDIEKVECDTIAKVASKEVLWASIKLTGKR